MPLALSLHTATAKSSNTSSYSSSTGRRCPRRSTGAMKAAMSPLLLLLAARLLAVDAAVAPPVYDPKLIVPDVKKCPIKNVDFEGFNPDSLMTIPDTLAKGNVSQKCQDEALSKLVTCFSDGTLQIQTGCCSKECADSLQSSVKSGCFAAYVKAICKDPASKNASVPLFHTAKRCTNFDAACEPATLAANATAKAANATAKPALPAATAAAAEEPTAKEPATKAEAPAPAPATPAKSSAVRAAAADVLALAVSGALAIFGAAVAAAP